MTAADEDEFTELVDATFPRVDIVGKGANGVPRWLIAKQDASAGLLEPAYIRGLIAKAEPDQPGRERVEMANGITLSGSAAGVAEFMARVHKAAERHEERSPAEQYEAVIKAKYSAEEQRKMLSAGHALKNDAGEPSYPIGDKDDLGKAIRAVGRGGPDHDRIRAYVVRRAKALGASSMIPDNWNSDGSLKESVSKEDAVAAVAKDAMSAAGDAVDLDDGIDGMDPTVPLAEPGEMGPGDPTDPGSPAWESIDAATACKWTSILARARVAVDVLAEREMLEAASADPDDAENAWDLQDVCCAIDYAISVLAPFAVAEQSAADCGEAELMAIGKAAALLGPDPIAPGPGYPGRPDVLGIIETFAAVRKAGRVLSSANEAAIRGAVESLQKVLASLPEAPVAKQAKPKEGTVPGTQTAGNAPAAAVAKEGTPAPPEAQAKDAGPVTAGGTTGLGEPRATGPDAALPGDGPQKQLPGDVPGRQVVKSALALVYDRDGSLVGVTDAAAIMQRVAKADGDGEKKAMQAVFDQDGDLIGIVDPDAIQPVTGAGGKTAADDGTGDGEAPPAAAAADDMTPQPAADAGTPADDVAKTAGGTQDAVTMQDVLKSITDGQAASAAHQAALLEAVAKMAAGNEELTAQVETLKARLAVVEEHPAAPKVFANGQVPPAHQLRGQDQGARQIDVAKARERKAELYSADAPDQARIAKEMQEDAVAYIEAMHAGR